MSAEWPVLTVIIEIGSTLARFPLRWAPKYTAFNYKTFSYFIVVIHLDDVFVASIAIHLGTLTKRPPTFGWLLSSYFSAYSVPPKKLRERIEYGPSDGVTPM